MVRTEIVDSGCVLILDLEKIDNDGNYDKKMKTEQIKKGKRTRTQDKRMRIAWTDRRTNGLPVADSRICAFLAPS
jgi:hypothetical protein